MGLKITVKLEDASASVINVTETDPIKVNLSMLPSLTQSWAGADSPAKNTFVDANRSAIESYFDGVLENIIFSTEADAAIVNIESNGGTLLDKEKYFVSIWVDRMQANGDWAALKTLTYHGFTNTSCTKTCWKTGVECTVSGSSTIKTEGIYTAGKRIVYNQTYGGLGVDGSSYEYGGYFYESPEINSGRHWMWSLNNARYTNGTEYQFNTQTNRIIRVWTMNSGAETIDLANHNNTRSLYGFRQDAGWTRIYQNGVQKAASALAAGGFESTDPFYYGDPSGDYSLNGTVAMSYIAAGSGFSQADFYAGFEDFRTSLHPEILYNLPAATGQVTSYRTGDDADIENKLFLHFRKAMAYWNGTTRKLVDFYTLSGDTLNEFGNTLRFTDDEGAAIIQGDYTKEYMIDHYTGLGWYRIRTTVVDIWDVAIDGALASSVIGFTDWFLPNNHQFYSTWDHGHANSHGWFSQQSNLFGSTTRHDLTTDAQYISNSKNNRQNLPKTSASYWLPCRKHY